MLVDDREKKKEQRENDIGIIIPSGIHSRPDVYVVMKEVGERVGDILKSRASEFERHGIVISHYEHGLFSFGRSVEEAFENGYRSVRNAQTIIYNRLLKEYPDERAKKNGDLDDLRVINS